MNIFEERDLKELCRAIDKVIETYEDSFDVGCDLDLDEAIDQLKTARENYGA